MIYSFAHELVPLAGLATDGRLDMKLCAGIIHRIEIVFPDGCMGLVSLGIYDALHQIWPTNPGEWFSGNDTTISYREDIELTGETNTITCYGFNGDMVYTHTPIIRIGILPKSTVKPWAQEYEQRMAAFLGME